MRGEDLEEELNRSGGTWPDEKEFISLKESKELWEKCPKINDVPRNLLCTRSQGTASNDGLRRSSGLLWQWRSRAHTTAAFFWRSKHLNEKNSRKKEDEPTWHWSVKSSRAGWALSPPHWGEGGTTRASSVSLWEELRGAISSSLASVQGDTDWLQKNLGKPLLLQSANRLFKGVMS